MMHNTISLKARTLLRTEDIATPIFKRSTEGGGKLSSPFARNFNIDQWKSALAGAKDNKRDIKLCLSALFFGKQVSSLRKEHVDNIFNGISKRSALVLAVGSANRNYLALKADFRSRSLLNQETLTHFTLLT